MAVIPVKFGERAVKALDVLVAMGLFKSRNEAIRKFIEDGLSSKLILFDERISEIIEKLLELEEPFTIEPEKSAWEIIAKECERVSLP